jgi:hypothetical protein
MSGGMLTPPGPIRVLVATKPGGLPQRDGRGLLVVEVLWIALRIESKCLAAEPCATPADG